MKLTVIGDADSVQLVSILRKHWQTEIISVGPPVTPKKEEPKKKEPKKEEAKKNEGNKEAEFYYTSSFVQPYCTSSFVDEAEVFGRHEEREKLLERLLGNSSGVEASKLDIIPIVGLGGIGKTTLAQLVYDDERVRKHFNIKMWVRVSDPFDEVRVAKEIVEALGGKSSDSLEALLQSVNLFIRGKKFLLVLDDVWVVEEIKWVQLKRHLEFGAKGSVILITARKESVAVMMSAETASMIRLQILPEQDCWDIFWQQASSGGDESEIQHLKDVGRQIALKCKGLPVLAKILGRLVHFKKTVAEWLEVLQSELWELGEEIETYIPLLLSYNDFSPLEKCCLLYCSVFPKGYEIDIDNLIDMWMSQGYLSGDENFEREGLSCFKQLAMRSFFQDFETDYNGNIIRCKMVEVVHDFVQFLAKDKFVILESAKKNITDQVINFQRARHVTCLIDKWISPREFCNKVKMHTLLFLHNSSQWHQDSVILQIDDIVEKQTFLRTLDLTSCYRIQLPVNIDKLMHLRYLNLSNNRVLEVLPDTLCNLFNLQTLRMSNCVKLRRLPEGLEKLVNLRHLYIDWCQSLEGLPKGIQKLSCLQTLAMYVVPDKNSPMDREALKLGDLMNMKLVQRSLCISRCQNTANAYEAESAELRNNEYLESLWLQFGPLGIHGTDFGGKEEEERRILEALQPHRNLISLCIGSYGGNILPNWIMSLIHLKRLDLFHIPNCETLPPLGSLPFLEFLDIFGMEKMKSLGCSFLGEKTGITKEAMGWQNESSRFTSFPKLKELCFYSMESWEEWECIDSEEKYAISEIMPCLESLEFSNCPRLKALPYFLKMTPLQRLEISFSDILESNLRPIDGRDYHMIAHIPSVTIGERPI